jgi:hypothetical protein
MTWVRRARESAVVDGSGSNCADFCAWLSLAPGVSDVDRRVQEDINMNQRSNNVEVLQALQGRLDPGSIVVTVELGPQLRQHITRFEYRFSEPAHAADDEVQVRSGSSLRSLLGMD